MLRSSLMERVSKIDPTAKKGTGGIEKKLTINLKCYCAGLYNYRRRFMPEYWNRHFSSTILKKNG